MLTQKDTEKIISFVKAEPRTVQDVARLIGRSWVTAESYLQKIKQDTGMIDVKTFRPGTQGALKIAYCLNPESLSQDELHDSLLEQIKSGKRKWDFDFLEIFQHISDSKKRSFIAHFDDKSDKAPKYIARHLPKAKESVYFFSGNLSFLRSKDNVAMKALEDALKRKVHVKILMRANLASVANYSLLGELIKRHPGQIEVRHRYQPLRGFVIDDSFALFRSDEPAEFYRADELERNTHIFYEFTDADWICWMQKVFWNLFRTSISVESRLGEIRKIK